MLINTAGEKFLQKAFSGSHYEPAYFKGNMNLLILGKYEPAYFRRNMNLLIWEVTNEKEIYFFNVIFGNIIPYIRICVIYSRIKY